MPVAVFQLKFHPKHNVINLIIPQDAIQLTPNANIANKIKTIASKLSFLNLFITKQSSV
jgi:hypothetical protein